MILNGKYDRDVIIYAFRYTLGRHSYAPSLMRDKLDEVWEQLDECDRNQILKEVGEHKEHTERISEKSGMDFNTTYDLSEWLSWREKKMLEKMQCRVKWPVPCPKCSDFLLPGWEGKDWVMWCDVCKYRRYPTEMEMQEILGFKVI